MRDFFAHITRRGESRPVHHALAYFIDLFPGADNKINGYKGILIATSNHLSDELIPSPFWCKTKGAFLFLFGEYDLPDSLRTSEFPKTADAKNLVALFEVHGDALFNKISGHFNALIFYPKEDKFVAVTSKLGLCPLYYCRQGNDLMVSSRLGIFKNILGSGEPEFPVIMQHCLYNYPISSKTFIKDLFLQPAGSVLTFSDQTLSIEKYWTIDQEIAGSRNTSKLNESIDLIDDVLDRIIRRQCQQATKIGLSLTGGWDGRLLLAYALKHLSPGQLLLYSHGTEKSPDVRLPLATANKLNLDYFPILLDDPEYLNQQLQWAADTVKYSDGMRSVTRLHYLYTMSVLRNKYGISEVISGNGGSNLLKNTNCKPCQVFNRFVIELIESEDYESTLRRHYEYFQTVFPNLFKSTLWSSFMDSFDQEYLRSLFSIGSKSRRFLHLLLSEIERKYFGCELQSYKHLVRNFSPFFDDEFIKTLARTVFITPDENKGILKSYKISLLYARLLVRNNAELAKEPTDRGFSMNDVANQMLLPRMLYKYFKNKFNRIGVSDNFCNRHVPYQYAQKYLSHADLFNASDRSSNSFLENYLSAMSFLQK